MLELSVVDQGTFVVLKFEHSLLSLSKWESKHKKPFLKGSRTGAEMLDYYEAMLLSPADGTDLVYRLTPDQMQTLGEYVGTPQTASSVPEQDRSKAVAETVTSELIYFWMVAMKINWEAQHWHLSRLMMLIEITNFKNQPEDKKKRPAAKVMATWREANERQKAMFKSKG